MNIWLWNVIESFKMISQPQRSTSTLDTGDELFLVFCWAPHFWVYFIAFMWLMDRSCVDISQKIVHIRIFTGLFFGRLPYAVFSSQSWWGIITCTSPWPLTSRTRCPAGPTRPASINDTCEKTQKVGQLPGTCVPSGSVSIRPCWSAVNSYFLRLQCILFCLNCVFSNE